MCTKYDEIISTIIQRKTNLRTSVLIPVDIWYFKSLLNKLLQTLFKFYTLTKQKNLDVRFCKFLGMNLQEYLKIYSVN